MKTPDSDRDLRKVVEALREVRERAREGRREMTPTEHALEGRLVRRYRKLVESGC